MLRQWLFGILYSDKPSDLMDRQSLDNEQLYRDIHHEIWSFSLLLHKYPDA